ncbi:MAG: hypothetical protein PHW12_09260 [Smithella sp.]|nr:hypothetical protein [Smithella sp.]
MRESLIDYMAIKQKTIKPLFAEEINGSYILAVYQGAISEYDILIKYRQKEGNKWSRIRTPKHIHWAVDVMIKMHSDKQKTERFLDFLINIWQNTYGIKSSEERNRILNIENLLSGVQDQIKDFSDLGSKGEYSIMFLILLAKLLMVQEKTNLETAYMFKNLLTSLKKGNDIFQIVSIATQTRR